MVVCNGDYHDGTEETYSEGSLRNLIRQYSVRYII